MLRKLLISLCFCLALTSNSIAFAKISWEEWVAELREEAIAEGINPNLFDRIFANIKPNKRVIHFDRTQPEKRLTFKKYRNTRASRGRINLGQKKYKHHQALLNEVGEHFGVDPCFITSLWGMESSYGHFMGSFPVITSLATLAYDSRRGEFFRKQLLYALQIVNDGHVALEDFKGEWAGASGQPQFLPSSWYQFAVDYNKDGRKDIWKTHADVFASIANYLKQNGWQTGEPWAIKVKLPDKFNKDLADKNSFRSVEEWNELGVRTLEGEELPHQNLSAAIVIPYGGPNFLAFKNFKTLLRYNNSIYYAGTVGYLADEICKR